MWNTQRRIETYNFSGFSGVEVACGHNAGRLRRKEVRTRAAANVEVEQKGILGAWRDKQFYDRCTLMVI